MSRPSRSPRPRAVRVLVVDDSPVCRGLLRSIVEADDGMVVVAEAGDGVAAIAQARRFLPDVITMDVRMPGLDGWATLERLMAETPRPVLVVTDLSPGVDGSLVFEATRRGALDVSGKPSITDERACRALRERLRLLASVPVVRHLTPSASTRSPEARERAPHRAPVRLIALAASAGGPAALATLLAALPASLDACIALTQHLPPGFAEPFARFLSTRTALRVVVGDRRLPLVPGQVVVAPDSAHLVARGFDRLEPSDAAARGGLRPSADVCFESIAACHGDGAVGVVLTGIGRDGAAGLAEMRRAGALTIAQDEASSAVYGMPRAAAEIGAAARVLPLHAIADELIERVAGGIR